MGNQEYTDGRTPEVQRRIAEDGERVHAQPGEGGEHCQEAHSEHPGGEHEHESRETHKELQIFVNRRRFGRNDGVKEQMTGGEIAALVGVPPGTAVIRADGGPDKHEIGINEIVQIKNGEHFLVTRKTVEGGHVA